MISGLLGKVVIKAQLFLRSVVASSGLILQRFCARFLGAASIHHLILDDDKQLLSLLAASFFAGPRSHHVMPMCLFRPVM